MSANAQLFQDIIVSPVSPTGSILEQFLPK